MTKFTTASKKVMSLLLAMLLAFSCMAVAANAEAPSYTKYVLDASNCVLNVDTKTLTVNKATIKIGETDYPITFSVENATAGFDGDGNSIFYNLEAGKSYTVKSIFTYNEIDYKAAEDYTIKLKNSQNAPVAPIPEKIKASTVTIKAITDAEYAILLKNSSDEPVYGESNIFKGLTAETQYKIFVRYKETESAYASPATTIIVTTLAASDQTVPATPVLEDKTNTSITVVKVEGQIYSIDGGVNWQSKSTFDGLKENTSYTIVTRKVYDEVTQEETPLSDGLAIITNKRACYTATIDKCTMTTSKDEPIYVESSCEFEFTCDKPGTADLVYGDTRYVASTYTTNQSGSSVYSCEVADTFTPTSTGDLKFNVTYILQKYNGSKWINVDTVTKTYKFKVVAKYYKIIEGFKKVLNVFLDTIPAAINKFLKSGSISKVIDAITKIGSTNY